MVCIPLCASILFVLPAGNHTNAIRAFVSYTRVRNHNSKCAPPAGHHRVALSISAPVNKNHCGFQVVFLHFAALLLQSLQHQSSLLLNFLPLGNQLIHIILFVQLSSHCLRIQLPHLTKGIYRPSCSWPPLSSSPQPRHWLFPVTELHVLSTAPLGDCDLRSGVSSGFPALRRVVASSLFNISLPYCLTSFRLAINWFISSFSSSFLATACGSSFPTHKGHLLPNMFLATALLLATAAPLITPYRAARSRHLWVTVIFGRGFQVVFLHFAALLLQSLQHQSSLLLNFLPLGNQFIHIILFVQLSSHCLRIQLPHPQRAFAAHHVLGHRSPLRHSRATDFPLPSCTFSARHLWVTVIFGRGFQVVFLHLAALLLQSLQHQSSLLLNFLPLGNQLIHIILFVQLSSHCLRIQLPHPQMAFAAHIRPSCSWPPLFSSPQPRLWLFLTELHVLSTAPLGDCDLRSGVSSGFLYFAALLLQSLQHQSSLFAYLPSTRQSTHSCLPFRPAL